MHIQYDKHGVLILSDKFITTNTITGTGRIYPRSLFENLPVRDNFFGQLGIPQFTSIELEKVSHRVTRIWNLGNDWYCDAFVMDTPMGNIVKEMVKFDPDLLSFYPLGTGSLEKKNDTVYVKDDYKLHQIYLTTKETK